METFLGTTIVYMWWISIYVVLEATYVRRLMMVPSGLKRVGIFGVISEEQVLHFVGLIS